MNVSNICPTRKKYFYTVLFLNNYYPPKPKSEAFKPETKIFEISEDTNSSNVKWLSDGKLWIRHNLKFPITMEMWDANGVPNFYCPILKDDIDSLSVGEIVIESNTTLTLDFTNISKPSGNEVFKLAMRSLPLFNLKDQSFKLPSLPLDEQIDNQTGLAIIFRRNSLDALFDLIAEFDESYWHSMAESYDLEYLTKESCYKDCYFSTKFTNELQDILDLIDVNQYNIKYSWENRQNNNPIYL